MSNVLTDEPRWSSASLCITLNHLGRSFRPEYTHQLTEGECFRGHRPRKHSIQAAMNKFNAINSEKEKDTSISTTLPVPKTLLHKSHEYHDVAKNELDIQISISPSCQKCSVDIQRFPISINGIDDNNNNEDEDEGKRTVKRKKTGNFSESDNKVPADNSEILVALRKVLPPLISQNGNNNNTNNDNNSISNDVGSNDDIIIRNDEVEKDFLSEPIGEILDEYSILTTTTNNFVLTIADGGSPRVSEYHTSVERLAMLYIENADAVDVANNDTGYWKILYLWKKDGDDHDDNDKNVNNKRYNYSLVAYFTIFHFIALFHRPEPGLIIRICQALVLPPFQGQGHGKRILQAVYNIARNQEKDADQKISNGNENENHYNLIHKIVQVNVEDPAPAFVALRNKIDWKLILGHYQEWKWPRSKGTINASSKCDELSLFFTALREQEASEMSAEAKITPKQIHIMNELLKLQAIHSFCDDQYQENKEPDANVKVVELERYFRLMVKKRLNKEYCDELIELPTKADQKLMLGKLFDDELKQYKRILRTQK